MKHNTVLEMVSVPGRAPLRCLEGGELPCSALLGLSVGTGLEERRAHAAVEIGYSGRRDGLVI